jgi:hypothetical protein
MIKVVFLAKFNQKIDEPNVNAVRGVNKPSLSELSFFGFNSFKFT